MQMRCLIVDDSESFLTAARVLLEREGVAVAGVASRGPEALRLADALRPDVVLVDICLGDESGVEVARSLIDHHLDHDAVVVMISTHTEDDVLELVARCQAAAFLPKSELSASAIRRIVDGHSR
jgi:DNA-binding NarL/FixJ family response regulator